MAITNMQWILGYWSSPPHGDSEYERILSTWSFFPHGVSKWCNGSSESWSDAQSWRCKYAMTSGIWSSPKMAYKICNGSSGIDLFQMSRSKSCQWTPDSSDTLIHLGSLHMAIQICNGSSGIDHPLHMAIQICNVSCFNISRLCIALETIFFNLHVYPNIQCFLISTFSFPDCVRFWDNSFLRIWKQLRTYFHFNVDNSTHLLYSSLSRGVNSTGSVFNFHFVDAVSKSSPATSLKK